MNQKGHIGWSTICGTRRDCNRVRSYVAKKQLRASATASEIGDISVGAPRVRPSGQNHPNSSFNGIVELGRGEEDPSTPCGTPGMSDAEDIGRPEVHVTRAVQCFVRFRPAAHSTLLTTSTTCLLL